MNADGNSNLMLLRKKNFSAVSICVFFVIGCCFFSCTTNKGTTTATYDATAEFEDGTPIVAADKYLDDRDTILLTFAGDIMAHRTNYLMKNYDDIYSDISPLLKESKLTFANLEAPVDDALPFSTFPKFNMNHSYPDAAINAGINVFSLANNHSTDQGLEGINATRTYFAQKMALTAGTDRPVYASGIKQTKNGPLTYQLIREGNWRILFVAVTEISNEKPNLEYVDYIKPTEKKRAEFIQTIQKMRAENQCDLFILSIHCSDPEYMQTIDAKQRSFYYQLLDAGVDIVWANHPHVAKNWEVIGTKDLKVPQKMVFYALGNTISGQRREPSFTEASHPRDYTGDGFIIQVRIERTVDGMRIVWVNPVLITTYITPTWNFVIKKLNDDFISQLNDDGLTTWATYLEERKKLMEKTKGITVWR